jgi:hypothetical protein
MSQPNENAKLSKLLFDAREAVDMYADVTESQMRRPADFLRRVVTEIDEYRAGRGWNPHGFGGEDDTDE